MPKSSGLDGGTLSQWLEDEGIVSTESRPGTIADAALVRSLLVAVARERRSISYAELLGKLGHRFTRPKMRALCRTLDLIDRDNAVRDEPAMAVLVVREADRLPGQGWWVGRSDASAWSGPVALAYVERLQRLCFDHAWRDEP